MNGLASLEFTRTGSLGAVALVGVVALGAIFWSYSQTRLPRGVAILCLLLRTLGISALLIALLDPRWVVETPKPGANLFAILADNSQGLRVQDADATEPRSAQLRKLLGKPDAGWQQSLTEKFDLHRFLFDSSLRPTEDFDNLDSSGQATSLGSALKGVRERFQGQPLAGVLLFTDGIATDIDLGSLNTDGLPPVYPVVLGTQAPLRDVRIRSVSSSQSSFEDTPVTLLSEIEAAGYPGQAILTRIKDSTGKVLGENEWSPASNLATTRIRMDVKPPQPGLSVLTLEVGLKSPAADTQVEGTLENNRRQVVVDTGQGPYRILYVSGRPNWEYKFLRRAVEEDPQIDLVALIRIARREPKFEFRGRAGETSNPLFRGFADAPQEELERYDQPVLIRLNTKDPQELKQGFPKLEAELFKFHAVILDDLEVDFFSPDQQGLLHRFVSWRGGSLLMLGGQESFQLGDYHRSVLASVLPTYMDGSPAPTPEVSLQWDLTREGWLLPWLRTRAEESAEKLRISSIPPFQIFNPARSVKPGAVVAATVQQRGQPEQPAFVFQRFGLGKSAALLVGDIWRWGLGEEQSESDRSKWWRQVMRWLVLDVPGPIQIDVPQTVRSPADPVEIRVRVKDGSFAPSDDSTVNVQVTSFGPADPDSRQSASSAETSPDEAGLYTSQYLTSTSGAYIATATATNAAGQFLGRVAAGWASDFTGAEFRSLTPDVALLTTLAKRTGGRILESSDLPSLAKRLPTTPALVTERTSTPIWHHYGYFAFALACLVSEWGIRRQKGAA